MFEECVRVDEVLKRRLKRRVRQLLGSLAAAAFMILVPEALRFVGLPGGIAANVRQMLYGAALVGVIWWQHSKVEQGTVSVRR